MIMKRGLAVSSASLVALACAGCLTGPYGWPDEEMNDSSTGEVETTAEAEARYHATIRWTADNVPHVTAESYGDAGFGLGYAFARDHACTLADQVLKVRSERARYLGPGYLDKHINSDLGHLVLDIMGKADATLATLDEDTRATIEGYTAGYNAYLEEVGPGAIKGWCAGADWIKPMEVRDLVAYHLSLGMVASSSQVAEFIATATPPGMGDQLPGKPPSDLGVAKNSGFGSNGWGIGKDKSAGGRGMVLVNPHFPWLGELRLWESHITIPGELNVYGAGLLGVPGINMGFNEHVAWTHTFSQMGQRMTIYSLDLVPGEPTKYYYGDEVREMTSQDYSISVKQDDGSISELSRTLYRTHYGPVLNVLGFGWNEALAATYRDANLNNDKLIPMVLEMNRARSMEEFKAAFSSTKGMPWAHTMSADDQGEAWYIDASATPNLSQETVDGWVTALGEASFSRLVYEEAGVMLIDGSDPNNEWVEEPGARSPGLVPHDRLPALSRTDYVCNANDSHWLTNAAQPLEGYPATHGFERTPQSVRTRTNLDILTASGEGTFAGPDGKFTLDELADAVLGNTSIATELLLEDVIARCQGEDLIELDNETYSIADACVALAGWDGRADLDSVGALVWREFLGSYSEAQREDSGALFSVGFDPDDPVATPNTLKSAPDEGADEVLRHLARAVRALADAGVPVDATLREQQYTYLLGGERFPVHGAAHAEGVMNQVFHSILQTSSEAHPARGEVINAATDLTDEGYPLNYGSSFLMVTEFTDDGPRAKAILTYGQSEDPDAADYGHEMEAFANKQWREVRFREADIAADPALVTLEVAGG